MGYKILIQLSKLCNTFRVFYSHVFYRIYYNQGLYEKALPYAKQVHKLQLHFFGDQHTKTATSINNLALLYKDMAEYSQAELLFQQALKIWQDTLDDQHPDTANGFNNLATLYYEIGDYTRAEPFYQQALKIWKETLGDLHSKTATGLNNQATLYVAMGDYIRAEPLFQQALKIRQGTFGDLHSETAISLHNLAMLYMDMGDYIRAEPLFQQALKIQQDLHGDKHPETATSLGNLAILYYEIGDYTRAKLLYQQALKIKLVVLGNLHPSTAISLHNLAMLYKAMGDYIRAEPLFQQALKIQQDVLGDQHPDTANGFNNLATLYYEIGDYTRAEPFYQQVLKIWKEKLGDLHSKTAAGLNNLAMLYQAMGDYIRAEPLFQQALKIWKETLGDLHPDTATSLDNLATLYYEIGDYTRAKLLYQQALKIKLVVLGNLHPSTAISLHNLAMLYKAMGDYIRAEPLFQQALKIQQDVLGDQHPDTATSLDNFAALYVAMTHYDLAMTLKMQASTTENYLIGQIFSFANESQRSTYLKKFKSSLSIFLSLVYVHLANNSDAVYSVLNLVLQRKAVLAEALASQRDAVLGGQYPELQSQFKKLSLLRMQIAQETLAGQGKEAPEIHRVLVAQWNSEKEQLEAELARQIPEMRLNEKLSSAGLQAIASKITASGTLIEFIRFDVFDFKAISAKGESKWQPARYLAFIIPASDPKTIKMIDLGEAALIDHEIAEFRSQITDSANQRDSGAVQLPLSNETHKQVGYELYELLFKPLQEVLGKNTRLLLSPDGDLNRLPFEVLPTVQGGLLIDHYDISYLAVGRDILHFDEKSGRKPTAPIVLADPDFDLSEHTFQVTPQNKETEFDAITTGRHSRDFNQANLYFGRLPGSRLEGERIGQLLGVKPWTDAAALEQDLKSIRSPVILHLATHGFFLEDQKSDPNLDNLDLGSFNSDSDNNMQRFNVHGLENPLLRSGLALAGVNTWLTHGNTPEAAEDGLLTAEDVTSLNLLDTELVVLSACETGLGEVQVGEGVLGLRRSFILAGAKTLIMSLWKVPDLATAILMERLYKNLLEEHLPRDQALREAQRYLSKVTIGEISEQWLNKRIIRKLAAGVQETENYLKQLRDQPDDHQPFQHPFYWGAFICQGDPSPLPSFNHT